MEKEWSDVEEFVKDLRAALDEEARTIREAELDHVGEYRPATMKYEGSLLGDNCEDVFVDRLGRVILPPRKSYESLVSVEFLDSNGKKAPQIQQVKRLEKRFKGEALVAYVVYLEEP